jgi:predicted porin
MRRSLISSLIVVVCLVVLGLPSFAEEPANPADKTSKHESSSSSRVSAEEVEQLRRALASQQIAMESQQKTIEELKTMVSALAQRLGTSDPHVLPTTGTQGARVQTLGYTAPSLEEAPYGTPASGQTAQTNLAPQKAPEKKPSTALEWTVGGTKIQLYGHADVSYDYVDNGITPAIEATNGLTGSNPLLTTPFILSRANNGWLGQISSNLSYFGVRGSHKINDYLTGVFQFETEISYAATPGPTSDNQCKYCLGSRDSYVGLQGSWGAVKIGKEDAPYKKTTVPLDPFYNTIGDVRSIMGNSGGDNRAEFMGRISHAIWYESPTYKGLGASILFSPGQNRSSDNGAYARAEPNCSGGNGVFVMSFQNQANVAEGGDLYTVAPTDTNPCNDGAWGNVLSTSITYRGHGLYGFGAYEHHSKVNRITDAVGVADEAAWKFGASYTYDRTGTTGSFIYEALKRYAPANAVLNERSRPLATFVALSQKLSKKDTFSVDWIHAGKTPGDPGQCALYSATSNALLGVNDCVAYQTLAGVPSTPASLLHAPNNQSNMYAAGVKHTLTRNMSTYFVYARQANHSDAHYDLGAVGHGVVVDKRDFTGKGFPGTRLQGLSGGLTFDF